MPPELGKSTREIRPSYFIVRTDSIIRKIETDNDKGYVVKIIPTSIIVLVK